MKKYILLVKLEKFFLSIIIMFVLITISTVFFLRIGQVYFFEYFYLSPSGLVRTNCCYLERGDDHNDHAIVTNRQGVKSYFYNFIDFSISGFFIFYKFLSTAPVDVIIKEVNCKKRILINKLMHQSFDLLNYKLISNTTTILELKLNTDQVYWVVQLGALKNLEKVLEIVEKLKVYNYPVYLLYDNDHIKQGDLIRIFVGPDPSKEHLKYILDDLYFLSNLRGKICRY